MKENPLSPVIVGNGDGRRGVYTIRAGDFNASEIPQPSAPTLQQCKDAEAAEIPQRPLGGKDVTHPTSFIETFIHILKANIGSGVFAMGDAFRNSGLYAGPICTVFIGYICLYAQHQLLGTSEETAKRFKLSYAPDFAETVELSFKLGPDFFRRRAALGRLLCNMFLFVTQIGFCSVYFVFVASNLKEVMDSWGIRMDSHLWMVIVFPPILFLSWVRNLKHLTPASLLSNALLATGLSLTAYMCVSGGLPSLDSRPKIARWDQFPLFFGTTVYCFEAISLIIPLRNEMKNPAKFSSTFGVLNLGVLITCLVMIAMGFVSYLRFGEDIKGSITLNLDGGLVLTKVVQLSIVVGIIFTYPIQAYVPIQLIWPTISEKHGPLKHPDFMEFLIRTLIVIFTFLLAESVPRLELFISLIGAVSSSALAIIFPPLLTILVYWDTNTSKLHTASNVAIILFGVIGCIVGTYTSMKEIFEAFLHGETSPT